ncbi:MFS transporter [Aeromicrobium camelliae]|uniref:MFS transporter n=1 Tax=Aeromicrobium camelliae TaxID=1538144 RepID=UPI001AA02D5A|nr:MFS transporter [Aeromicrobium camelliae]
MVETGFAPEQRRVLPTILVPAFLSLLSVSIVNVALPAVESSLGAGTSGLQWVVSGYALAFGVLLVAAGRAGDLWGRGRLFILGLAIFAVGSLGSGLAPSIAVLNLARAVMGIGSGLLTPQVSGIIQQFFQGELRGRAFGALGSAVGVSVAIGPVLGGVFITSLGPEWGWRWCFLINVPIAITGIVAARVFLPPSAWKAAYTEVESSTPDSRRRIDFDPVGMLLLALATLLVMVSFMEAGWGWWSWGFLVLGSMLVVGWVRWELRYRRTGRTPMVDMQLFRTRSFASGGDAHDAVLPGLHQSLAPGRPVHADRSRP